MKPTTTLAALLAIATLHVASPVFAADQAQRPEGRGHGHGRPAPTAEERAKWEAMTPEQRKAEMDARRAEHEKTMTPEQKAEREARRAQWEAMTPEEREAARKARGGLGPDGEKRGRGPRPQS